MKLTLKDIAMTIWRSIVLIIVASLIGSLIFAGVTCFFIKPEYTATAKLYVYNEKTNEQYISSSDLTVSKSLVDTYLIIIKSDPVLEKVQQDLESEYPSLTTKQILSMLTGSAINETEAFYISAKCDDRQMAKAIIDDIVKTAPDEIIRVVKAASVEIIEEAKLPEADDYEWPIIPNTLIGFAIGLVLSVAYVIISNAVDTTIYGKNELINTFTLPIIGIIPQQAPHTENSFKRKKKNNQRNTDSPCILAKDSPFAIGEAYRKTRSNIVYLPDTGDENCKTLVVTSALASEGKSTLSINLAISLAQSGNKVLLIDGDMRKPKVAKYLNLEEDIGFAEYLAKLTDELTPIDYAENLQIILSGHSTSYAAELLSTDRAKQFLSDNRGNYDYIIIDSPPVNEVSDTMTLVDQVTGYIMCAVAGYSDVEETKLAVSSLEQIGAKILGFVVIGVDPKVEQYGRYKRYGYGKNSYRSYRYYNGYYYKKKYYTSSDDKKKQ